MNCRAEGPTELMAFVTNCKLLRTLKTLTRPTSELEDQGNLFRQFPLDHFSGKEEKQNM